MDKLFEQIKLWASIICGVIVIISLVGCTVTANRKGDKLTLKGWGAKGAKWGADGSAEISKEEPLQTPDFVPTNR